jgi:hypothetical protein
VADDAVVAQMLSLIQRWEESSDQRAIFLSCYCMMTRNMRIAIEQDEFYDVAWVDHLVEHFASYYFVALEAYERDPAAAPRVWQQAHQATQDPEILALQKLLLGVNAHINYDLVLSMVDVLGPEWADLSEEQRARRYADYCHVNEVIGCTIDAVQDQVVEPAMPVMDLIDRLFGPLDEKMISGLLARWRENVWRYAVQLLEAEEEQAYARLIGEVEQDAIRTGDFISLKRS